MLTKSNDNASPFKSRKVVGLILLLAVPLLLMGCATTPEHKAAEEKVESRPMSIPATIEDKWGIKVLSVRLTAADHMIDFRYRILDSEKALTLVQRHLKPYLIDQATGTKLSVPRTRLGPMRQSSVRPIEGRNYIILFGNSGRLVKQGSQVTVVVGDLKIENLVVE